MLATDQGWLAEPWEVMNHSLGLRLRHSSAPQYQIILRIDVSSLQKERTCPSHASMQDHLHFENSESMYMSVFMCSQLTPSCKEKNCVKLGDQLQGEIKRTRYIRSRELDHSVKVPHDLRFTQNFELEKERESEVRINPRYIHIPSILSCWFPEFYLASMLGEWKHLGCYRFLSSTDVTPILIEFNAGPGANARLQVLKERINMILHYFQGHFHSEDSVSENVSVLCSLHPFYKLVKTMRARSKNCKANSKF